MDEQKPLNPTQRSKVMECYKMIAELLPVEGKDYSISFSFDENNENPKITLYGTTDIGKLWVEYLYNHLGKGHR